MADAPTCVWVTTILYLDDDMCGSYRYPRETILCQEGDRTLEEAQTQLLERVKKAIGGARLEIKDPDSFNFQEPPTLLFPGCYNEDPKEVEAKWYRCQNREPDDALRTEFPDSLTTTHRCDVYEVKFMWDIKAITF